MNPRNLRLKLKMPLALMLISTVWATSASAVQRPSLGEAPMPNYDIRTGYTSLDLNDPREKEEPKALRSQRSGLLASALPVKTFPVISPDKNTIKELFGEGVTATFNGSGAPSLLFREKGTLTVPLNVSAEKAARNFLQNNQEVFGLDRQEIADLKVVRTLTSQSGSKQVNLQQTINGLPVFGADFKVGLNEDHAVLSVGGKFYPNIQVSGRAALTVAEVVQQAARHVGEWSSNGSPKPAEKVWDTTLYLPDWSEASLTNANRKVASKPQILKTDDTPEHKTIVFRGPFQSDVIASQVVFPLTKTQGRLAWRIYLHKTMTEWYQLVVDAENGNLLNRTNLVQFANERANVFLKNPGVTPLSTQSLLGVAPATVGSYAFASSSGQAGNNVFMMIGANEKPATLHDYTYPFANSYQNTGSLQTINLATDRKLTFTPNKSGGYNMTTTALTAMPAGTNLAMTDDSAVCGPPGFAFSYFGQAVSSVCVNSNGNVTFGTGDPRNFGNPLDLPPRGRIMPLHTDLNPGTVAPAAGTVSVDFVPNSRLCFNWNGVPEFVRTGSGGSNTFSTCLFSNNTIWLQYPTGGLTAKSAFVGIRPPALPGSIQSRPPTGASAWTTLAANDSSRGKTGLVRFFPDMGSDEKVLATNLFWQFNNTHDRLWTVDGFNDEAGNFQLTNTGGGIGGDPVILSGIPEKLGTNNAFFGTPPDGQCCGFSGFFLFTKPPFLNVHSGFDTDVTRHEYAHGLTNRLVGGPGNAAALFARQSGAMGEGWSDFYALSYGYGFNPGDNVEGEWATGNAATGIRRVAYTATNGRELGQYGNILGPFFLSGGNKVFFPEVHDDGEIWASFLADVRRALIAPAPGPGLTGPAVEKLVTEALFFTPSNPSMVEAANALFIADASLYGGSHSCTLWNVLKGRGFGKHAANNDFDPSTLISGNSLSVFTSRDRPTRCGGSFSRGVLKSAANFDTAAVGATTADGWTATPAGLPNLWHVTARRFTTGARSFYYGQETTGNYNTGATTFGSLISPVLNLAGTTNPVLEFDAAMSTENLFPLDTLWVQLSTNSGATYPIQRSILAYTTFDFFFGDIKFQRIRIDLKPLKGVNSAKVRLYFDTLDAAANAHEGIYVDNIQVRDYVEN